jgi:hypothetical protein
VSASCSKGKLRQLEGHGRLRQLWSEHLNGDLICLGLSWGFVAQHQGLTHQQGSKLTWLLSECAATPPFNPSWCVGRSHLLSCPAWRSHNFHLYLSVLHEVSLGRHWMVMPQCESPSLTTVCAALSGRDYFTASKEHLCTCVNRCSGTALISLYVLSLSVHS